MRTYKARDWTASLEAWASGEFSDEWKPYRHQAAMRGLIYPPAGTKWDSWEEDEPSQRAILIRAIRQTPKLLAVAIERSTSWNQVVGYVLGHVNEWAEEAEQRERTSRQDREDEPNPAEAVLSLRAILDRVAES